MTSIGLSMIVRDEEAVLADCLVSLEGVADELCVLDTGSKDATLDVARAAGARVESANWTDDFSAARNRALEMLTTDYVLVLDADERLATADARAQLLEFAGGFPRHVGRVALVDEGELGRGRSRLVRFFPRAGARWRRRIHEQVTVDGKVPPSRDVPVELRHLGYQAQFLTGKDKIDRNLKLLRASLEDHPEDAYEWFQLGRTYFAGARYEEALEGFAQALDRVQPGAPFLALLFELNAHALRKLKRSAEALVLLQQVSGAFQDRSDTVYVEALLAMDVGDLERAEGLFQRCLIMADNGGVGGASQEMTRTWAPAYHLGVMREVLGLPAEAIECYRRVLDFLPEHQATLRALDRLGSSMQ